MRINHIIGKFRKTQLCCDGEGERERNRDTKREREKKSNEK